MKALTASVSTAQQAIVDYVNAANAVSAHAASINALAIPDLLQPPPNYGDYVAGFTEARIHVAAWMTEVVPSFTAIPQSFVNFNQTVQDQLGAIGADLQQLASKGGDTASLEQTIRNAVSRLQGELQDCKGAVDGLDTAIADYQQSLQPDGERLGALAAAMVTAAGADEAAIQRMNAVVKNLADLVKERNQLATLTTLGNWDLNVFIAVAGVAVGLPFSAVGSVIAGLVFGVASASFTSFYSVNTDPDFQQTVGDIQKDMTNINQEIGWLNTTMGLLQAVNAQITGIVAACDTVRGQVAAVLNFWVVQDQALRDLEADLDDLLVTLSAPGGVAQAQADLEAARASWQDLESSMQPLGGITYVVSALPLPGSQDQ